MGDDIKSKINSIGKDELQRLLDTSVSYADVLRKLGLVDRGGNYATLKRVITKNQLSTDLLDVNRTKANQEKAVRQNNENNLARKIPLKDILDGKVDHYQSYKLKERLIKEGYKEYKCECCGLTEWRGKPIPLELHHKDGNHDNNKLDNLEILCPNCHAQTDNYTGKNIKINKKSENNKIIETKKTILKNTKEPVICPICKTNKMSENAKMCSECYKKKQAESIPITKEELKDKIRTYSFVQIGREFDVSDNAVRKWCIKFGLPHRTKDIKKVTDEEWNLA